MMKATVIINFCAVFFINIQSVLSRDLEQDLLDALRGNLTKYSPPSGLYNDTVYVDLQLIKFLNVDQKKELVVLTIFQTVTYHVPRISWDPEDYGGLDVLAFSAGVVWTPEMGLFEMCQNFIVTISN